MVNIEKFKQTVSDSGMTVTAICNKSGIQRQTYYNRLENPDFSIAEVDALQKTLHLSFDDVRAIFFADDVELN